MKNFKFASVLILLCACSSVFAQETKADRAIKAVKELCLTGTQFDLKADAQGNLTLTKLLPGGGGAVSVNVRQSTGAAAIFDEKIRQIADEDIRRCIQPYIKPIIDTILSEKPQSSSDKIKDNIALRIKEPAEDLAKRAESASIPGSIEAKSFILEYNRLLQEAKDELPNIRSIQGLRDLEYTGHYRETGKQVATAARKLARVADQLMVGDTEQPTKAPPSVSPSPQNVSPAPTNEKRAPNPNWPYCEPVESGYIHPLCAERILGTK